MNLVGHLECFVAVAEELHFGHAAERLGMAQPPLSQRIQRLERELGIRLFDRSSRHVELTPPGRLLLEEARDILARVDRIYSLAARARLGAVGTVRAGLPAGLGGPVLAALIEGFREHCPDLRLELRELGSAEQGRALTEGALDVGVLRHPCDVRDLELGPMLLQPVGAVLPAGSPHGARAALHPADLAGREVVLFPREDAPGAHDELLAACRRHGLDPSAVHEARHPQFALGLVLAGTAVALTPRTEDAEGAVWRPFAGDPLALRTSCAWPRGRRDPVLERAVEHFTSIATGVLRRHAGMVPLDRSTARRVVARPSSGFLA
ncbi:DNA-binding transcriptional regulator, LysR family [Thermomonospora echinospora]|uniref:DNA-binding transcriptional regulator, LysR family n=1 Tax=Thermomonospora echinospora TaxID=1992 RepID=A0A1H6A0B8_9ACTN|nr:LysR family transcriptional regulator [Thermomonospora echinospora]SEG41860.1 DNA-binding transcriptional regulator, LysR family [Thermomonospora echinospora]